MDRTAWIAIILSVCGLFAWEWYYQRVYGEQLRRQQSAQLEAVKAADAETLGSEEASSPAASSSPDGMENVAASLVQGELETSEAEAEDMAFARPVADAGDQTAGEIADGAPDSSNVPLTPKLQEFRCEDLLFGLTNAGGGISRVELLKHTIQDDTFVTVNRFGTVPIGAVGMKPGEFEAAPYDMQVDEAGRRVVFHRKMSGGLTVEKMFELPPTEAAGAAAHTVRISLTFTNSGTERLRNDGYYVNLGSIAPVHELDLSMYSGFDFYSLGKDRFIDVNWFQPSRIPLLGIQTRGARPEFVEDVPSLSWGAVKNQYFCSLLTVDSQDGDGVWAKRFEVALDPSSGKTHPAISGALRLPGFDLAPGESVTRHLTLYTGPNRYDWLKSLGASQEVVLRYGIFKPVSLALLVALEVLHNFLAGSYALAIIALTVVIKMILWPLQNKATKSMRRMAALSPKMTELREKYKDDPTRMNQELMQLYKDYGVNPFGGCLPMLIQIPIFFGFYSMLRSSVELRNSSFLWVNDLSQPDTVFTLFGLLPINPLPLLMAATMYWQMQITPKTADNVQQRIFLFMPLIFLFFCYNFASALALYWTVSNLISIVQLYMTRNQPIPAMHKLEKKEKPAPDLGMGLGRRKPRKPGGKR